MEMWTEVRRWVLTGELSKRAACREYGINWRTLAKMLSHVEPPGYRRQAQREQPVLGPHLAWVHEVLEQDKQEPKKQRHTAKRIFDRLKVERGFTGGYTVVKDAVQKWKATTKEVFVPLSHPPGEAQVDFGFAYVDVAGERQQVALFVMSLPYSDAVYIQAFPRECTEAFLEGHNRAFRFIGGVPRKIRYDNSKVAVAKITGSRERQVTKEFQRLQSHYLFETQFCLVRRANEKGHVECLVDFGRANFLVPVPKVASLVELNETLEERCRGLFDGLCDCFMRLGQAEEWARGSPAEEWAAAWVATLCLARLGATPTTSASAPASSPAPSSTGTPPPLTLPTPTTANPLKRWLLHYGFARAIQSSVRELKRRRR